MRFPVVRPFDTQQAAQPSLWMGNLLPSLVALTSVAVNGAGQSAGPFMARVSAQPAGWAGPYVYTSSSTRTFSITNNGDGTTVTVP